MTDLLSNAVSTNAPNFRTPTLEELEKLFSPIAIKGPTEIVVSKYAIPGRIVSIGDGAFVSTPEDFESLKREIKIRNAAAVLVAGLERIVHLGQSRWNRLRIKKNRAVQVGRKMSKFPN